MVILICVLVCVRLFSELEASFRLRVAVSVCATAAAVVFERGKPKFGKKRVYRETVRPSFCSVSSAPVGKRNGRMLQRSANTFVLHRRTLLKLIMLS